MPIQSISRSDIRILTEILKIKYKKMENVMLIIDCQ